MMTDNRTTELLPCPFCGGEAKESSPESNGTKFWRITCQHCYARIGGTHRGMNQAAWNTRAMHGTLTADDVRDLIERHSDASGGNGRDFRNGAYKAIADELNTRAERTCEACAFSKPTDLTDGCAALERIAELEEECDQLREAVAYWQRMYEEQIGVRR